MAELKPTSSAPEGRGGYEAQDLSVAAIGKFLIGLFALICLTLVAMNELFQYFNQRAIRQDVPLPPLVESREIPPEPRLQVTPAADLQKLRAAEQEILTTYGWIDRQRGIVRVPIDRAMDLLLERGLVQPPQSGQPSSALPNQEQSQGRSPKE